MSAWLERFRAFAPEECLDDKSDITRHKSASVSSVSFVRETFRELRAPSEHPSNVALVEALPMAGKSAATRSARALSSVVVPASGGDVIFGALEDDAAKAEPEGGHSQLEIDRVSVENASAVWLEKCSDADPALVERARSWVASGCPAGWAFGTLLTHTMPVPHDWPPSCWPVLLKDAAGFCSRWGAQARRLGWKDWELFGCCRRAPWRRIQGMGLVPLLRGNEIAALTETEAAIRTARNARLTHYRKPHDPPHPAERCLVWELDVADGVAAEPRGFLTPTAMPSTGTPT